MLRSIKLAGLGLALALASSGVALAQDGYHYPDRDDHRYDDHRYDDHGYYDRDDHRDYDRDHHRRDYGRYGYDDSGLRIARNTGFDDGAHMAYHDLTHYKPFDPYPRGKFAHEDHGYHHEYGDKYAYRAEYERGYRAGYASTFRRY